MKIKVDEKEKDKEQSNTYARIIIPVKKRGKRTPGENPWWDKMASCCWNNQNDYSWRYWKKKSWEKNVWSHKGCSGYKIIGVFI